MGTPRRSRSLRSNGASRHESPCCSFFAVFFFCLIASQIALQVYRYRRVSTPVQRQQTKWVIFGFVLSFGSYGFNFALVYGLLFGFFHIHLSPLGNALSLLPSDLLLFLFPPFIGFAILRYRLWDIDILINRALVYGTLTVSVVGLYVLVVAGLGALLQAQGNLGLALLATGLIAVLFQPLHTRLQRGVNRLLYGERDDPYQVISRLGQRLEATLDSQAVLPTIVETVTGALKLPYAAIRLKQDGEDVLAASSGQEARELTRLPLVYQGEAIGDLVLAPRARGESFSPADRVLLADLARQAGIAVNAVRLTADLQRSRERLVITREEERRRLRRDLHDGLGPTLASLTLKLDAARLLLTQNPSGVAPLLVELKTQMQETIGDIRRLVYDLRPPALDELGLVSALREQATQFSQLNGVQASIEMPEQVPRLSAALEVAIYRIVLEALTNVARHAQAQACCIRLDVADALSLEVSDDGVGLPNNHRTGVGIASMRERAAELGGTCVIESGVTGGTHVLVHLPLAKE